MYQFISIVANTFKIAYDQIYILILVNILWFFSGLFPIAVVFMLGIEHLAVVLVAALLSLLTLGPATAGLTQVVVSMVHDRQVQLWEEYKSSYLRFLRRSALLVVINAVILLILAVDLYFSLSSPSQFIRLLTILWVYFILFWFVIVQFVFPILVQWNLGVLEVMKRSALLVLDNAIVSLLLALIAFLLTLIGILFVVPIALFLVGLLAIMQNLTLIELSAKYEQGHILGGQ